MQANQKQQEAINQIEWPLLILAGAWSWKTATLTKRVENMITNHNINPASILMVTFTNKAANEMRERVAKTLWIETPKNIYSKKNFPLIWTFHSIGIFMLKEILTSSVWDEVWEIIWIKKDFVIYDEQDKISVLKSILKTKLNLDEKEYPAKQISFYISNAKNSLITAKAYEKQVDNSFKEVVFQVYTHYEKELSENNSLDFDDILIKTYALLRIEKILDFYQEKYKYLMVDEYQDTNTPQYEIVKLLASKYRNLAVVWDDAQSIYSWRWADMRNIMNFKKDYPEALIVKLEQNYRSTKNIIAWANSVIKNNTTWIKKELWTDNQTWEFINYIEAPDDKSEAKIIASIIEEKIKNPPAINDIPLTKGELKGDNKYKDNLILYRTNAQSRQIEEALMWKNIPYKVIWWLKFYDRKEIKDLLAYLKILHNPNDSISLKRIVNVPPRKIWPKTVEILEIYKNNFSLPYFSIIENIDEVEELNSWAKSAIKNFSELYNYLSEKSKNISLIELLKEIVKITKYEEYITEWLSEEEKESKKQNISELENLTSEYIWIEPKEALWSFLEDISLLTDMDKNDQSTDFVTLMTIHTSKWLEEKRVFLTWLEEWIFPSFRSVSNSQELEEERRLMYVAMTRAREELYISRAKERFHFWDYVKNPESRFIKEIDENFIKEYDLSEYLKNSWTNFFDSFSKSNFEYKDISGEKMNAKLVRKLAENDISNFKIWDKVAHHKFGNGIITELNWEIASIAFSGQWIKKMNIKIAPVRKI